MGAFLTRNFWVIPLGFAVALAVVGWSASRSLEQTMKQELASLLQTVLNAEVAALQVWVEENTAVADVAAADERVRGAALELLAVGTSAADPRDALLAAPAQQRLREILAPAVERHGFIGWGVINQSGYMVGNVSDDFIGRRPRTAADIVERILGGETAMSAPLLWDPIGDGANAVSAIIAGAPIRDDAGDVVALLGFAIDPAREYATLLQIARPGETGETYVFDSEGLLLSPSRFDPQLRELGLLPEDPEVSSFRNIHVRDPGGDLSEGHEPSLPVKARPLTRMAAEAVTGSSGVDVEGYRDYRGIPVAGAWTWRPDAGIGIATEIDIAEAYRGLFVVRSSFRWLIGLLVLAGLGMLLYTFVVMRLRGRVDEARQLGRYRIERKLGAGGMGTVYLASHALLRRPTAIKVLASDDASRESVARFEREVQVSSVLSHPNTIEIFDYGHTPDGTFYYAMEYLDGVTLGTCVESEGAQPEARVLHVMRQVCGSVAEAHAQGLIHRDLKPANIMLCERGGLADFVKVLDFGLVKQQDTQRDLNLTDITSLTGTPLYLPPEAVQAPEKLDIRADLYQIGAIAYYLLTGRHLFKGDSAYDVLAQHVTAKPVPPSEVLGAPVSPDLEAIILRCLEKSPADRPAHAGELLGLFERCRAEGSWGQAEARGWWLRWRERHPPADDASQGSHPSGYTVDVLERLRDEGAG